MAFNYNNSTFVSFAVTSELQIRDQRLFEANEGLTTEIVNNALALASQRCLTKIRNTDWWKEYQFTRNSNLNNDLRLLPSVNPDNIKSREQEFKDLNIYFAMAEYLLPKVADFGNETSAEMVKIKFYKDSFNNLFDEIIQSGDWYDFDADGNVENDERQPSKLKLVRIR
jgi:hypothetical protein